jgi:thioredoxin 1
MASEMKKNGWPIVLLVALLASCQKEAPPSVPRTSAPVTTDSPAAAPAAVPVESKPEASASAPPVPAQTPKAAAKTQRPATASEKKPAASAPQAPMKAADAAPVATPDLTAKAEPVAKPQPVTPAEPAQNLKISDADFDAKVTQAPGAVLVYVVADWCAPCQVGAKIVDEIAVAYAGRMKVMTLNIKTGDQTVKKYKVEGLPTTLIFKKGKVEGTNLGWKSRADLTAFVEGTL